MARWQDLVEEQPEFAAQVKERFDGNRHKLLATLRKDGSPRISGIETTFADGELWLGMMPASMKLRDLRRDGRFALHTSSEDPGDDPSGWTGDAKVAGVATEVHDVEVKRSALRDSATGGYPPDDIPLFRLDLTEAVILRLGDPADHMLVELWRPGQPVRQTKRT